MILTKRQTSFVLIKVMFLMQNIGWHKLKRSNETFNHNIRTFYSLRLHVSFLFMEKNVSVVENNYFTAYKRHASKLTLNGRLLVLYNFVTLIMFFISKSNVSDNSIGWQSKMKLPNTTLLIIIFILIADFYCEARFVLFIA